MSDPHAQIPLTGGADFWHTTAVPDDGLAQVMWTDGPHGVRKQSGATDHVGLNESEPATCFPPAVALGSSWNTELVEQVGRALADECRALGVGLLLGPGLNLKRSPLCGRNFEYFSEDPIVSGELASALVRGIQSRGVGTSVKHFAANNQETDRMRRDSQVDERTLRELYLRGFAKVIQGANPWSVMCSYNVLNGVQVSENHWLLTDVLREEWGYDGVVVSDWGAVWNRVNALRAGLDLEMPANPAHEDEVHQALEAGQISEATIDQAYQRMAKLTRRLMATLAEGPELIDESAHHALARQMAEQCVVLLTNDGVLPLAREHQVAVIGEFARTPRYQGAGSSRVNPTRLDDALTAIETILGQPVPFAPGFTTAPGQELPDSAVADAVKIAQEAEIVLLFLGLGESHESEGYDRENADLPAEQLALLEDVLQVNSNVVVVLSNGASVLLPFADRVRAIVEGWLLGQAGGSALARVLYGLVNPSGKLTETIPQRLQDVPSYLHFPGDVNGVRYGEGLFVGYRGYDATGTAPAFPFGHGLSYTKFDYSALEVEPHSEGLEVSFTITNTGPIAGREVAQVYLSLPASGVVRAPRELKSFASVQLESGASERVRLQLPAEDLAYWSVRDQSWVIEGGDYLVEIGASSRDLRLVSTVEVGGNEPKRPLTVHSTLAEAMELPGMEEQLRPWLSAFVGEDDPDVLRAVEAMPIASLLGFSGQSLAEGQAFLDEANAANE